MLLSLGWPVFGVPLLLFIAWVPMLYMEQQMSVHPRLYRPGTVFAFSYLGFFTWNLCVTWWVYNASLGGAAMAIIANSFLMALVFMLYSMTKRRLGERFAPFIFISYWIGFEYFHLDWDLSWPWLTLGNAFANNHTWIQWYEYTGVFGGSLWVLTVNVIVFSLIKEWIGGKALKLQWKRISIILASIIIPIVISYVIYAGYDSKTGDKRITVDVVVVQPNIDPYNAKFTTDPIWQAQRMISIANTKLDERVDYLVLPETALSDRQEIEAGEYVYGLSGIWEDKISESKTLHLMNTLVEKYPKLKIVAGASTNKYVPGGKDGSPTARQLGEEDFWFDSFNTGLQMDSTGKVQLYHKSKLVPGVEKMPFPALFKPLEAFAIDLGGTSGSLGMQDDRTVFLDSGKKTGVAPVICYESIYGEYVTDYVKNGADLIFIITNDGWWGDTPGYKQHLAYGTLRAIETRTCIARSANTGISCFINEKGDVEQPLGWWVEGAIRQKLPLNGEPTFYTRYGDYIARISGGVAVLLLLSAIAMRFIRNKKS